MSQEKSSPIKPKAPKSTTVLWIKYIITVTVLSVILAIFSFIMLQVVSYRGDIIYENYKNTSSVYNGPLTQSAPTLEAIDLDSSLAKQYNYAPYIWQQFVENTSLTKTEAKVDMKANFVKKGLSYQPSYNTTFYAKYYLENSLDKESIIKFEFPFPSNIVNGEISNAVLKVNGEIIKDAKSVIVPTTKSTYEYDSYKQTWNGLKWEGKIAKNSTTEIEVQYNTVGMSYFTYQGIDNPKKSQDINLVMTINGTRSYNIASGLSVDNKEFGDNFVKLTWDKKDLFSQPEISVSIGDKIDPSEQVARVYFTVVPIFIVMISIILFLAYKFAKPLAVFDVVLVSFLYALFFPLLHYLSSFTIDPTIEIFSGISNIGEFSMPLYMAFGVAFLIIGGLIYYFIGKISGFKFSSKFVIPCLVLFLGFFPLVVTIPEYSILLVLVGVIALLFIVVQTRIKLR